MAINRNENTFGPLLTIISILVIALLIAFTVHKTVPVVPADEEYMGCHHEGNCGQEECGCGQYDDDENGEDSDDYEDVD